MFRKLFAFVVTFAVIFSFSHFKLSKDSKPKVYDCFLFFNEFDLLKIRLREMAEHVDKFVIVEAAETFRGDPKPLYFAENAQLFDEYKGKIIHVAVKGHFEAKKPFHRERYQRNQILRGLKDCRANDIIIVSDVDEIVRQKELPKIIDVLSSKKAKRVVCYQKMYMYYLNRYQSPWPGTAATTFNELKTTYKSCPTFIRKKRLKKSPFILQDAGWHFSYMGGEAQMLKKIAAFSHSEVDTPEGRAYFLEQLKAELPFEEIDDTFPLYVQEHKDELLNKGFIRDRL